jgi:hypothetical protein
MARTRGNRPSGHVEEMNVNRDFRAWHRALGMGARGKI